MSKELLAYAHEEEAFQHDEVTDLELLVQFWCSYGIFLPSELLHIWIPIQRALVIKEIKEFVHGWRK